MAFSEFKITDELIKEYGVQDNGNTSEFFSGNVQDVRKLFDRLVTEVVKVKLNNLIDKLDSADAADSLKVDAIESVTSTVTSLQSALDALKEYTLSQIQSSINVLTGVSTFVYESANNKYVPYNSETASHIGAQRYEMEQDINGGYVLVSGEYVAYTSGSAQRYRANTVGTITADKIESTATRNAVLDVLLSNYASDSTAAFQSLSTSDTVGKALSRLYNGINKLIDGTLTARKAKDFDTTGGTIKQKFDAITNHDENSVVVDSAKYYDSTATEPGSIKVALAGKANAVHEHNYAGASSAGGAATSAINAQRDGDGNIIKDTYLKKIDRSFECIPGDFPYVLSATSTTIPILRDTNYDAYIFVIKVENGDNDSWCSFICRATAENNIAKLTMSKVSYEDTVSVANLDSAYAVVNNLYYLSRIKLLTSSDKVFTLEAIYGLTDGISND